MNKQRNVLEELDDKIQNDDQSEHILQGILFARLAPLLVIKMIPPFQWNEGIHNLTYLSSLKG